MAVGAILAALIVAHWYDMRRNFRALRAEVRAEIQGLREDLRADIRHLRTGLRADFQGLRQEIRADLQNLRADVRADSAHIRGDLTGLRKDIQALTVRMARVEGFLVGYFAETRPPRPPRRPRLTDHRRKPPLSPATSRHSGGVLDSTARATVWETRAATTQTST